MPLESIAECFRTYASELRVDGIEIYRAFEAVRAFLGGSSWSRSPMWIDSRELGIELLI